MASVKLTKTELKKQKDQLKRFQRYLPTLQLKKQQLQLVIRRVEQEIAEYTSQQQKVYSSLLHWIHVFGENSAFPSKKKLDKLVLVDRVMRRQGNIAGVPIPVFEDLTFKEVEYSLDEYPLWIDRGIEALRSIARFDAIITVLEKQKKLLSHELRITSQRVNLFEKIKIPEARDNIRRISIALGDQQTAAVVRGKIAKNKLMKVS
ncbi:MAG: V-type ATP synthase subunit D [Spirochaetota bacterium]